MTSPAIRVLFHSHDNLTVSDPCQSLERRDKLFQSPPREEHLAVTPDYPYLSCKCPRGCGSVLECGGYGRWDNLLVDLQQSPA